MELAKRQQQSTAVERVSQNVIVQTLANKQFKKVSEALPARIVDTLDLPKLREMAMATSDKNVRGFIEFELIKLAERINVSGNLTDAQIEFIASQLYAMYPNETIADFKLCFERASGGAYGKCWKLDGVEVGNWMKAYLDEKYQVMENQLMAEKDEQYKRPLQNTDWLQLWKESIDKTDEQGGVKTESRNIGFLNHLRAITPDEARQEGQETPKKATPYIDPHTAEYYETKDRIRRAATEFYRDRHSYSKMQLWTVGAHEVFAESLEDAEAIYKQALK